MPAVISADVFIPDPAPDLTGDFHSVETDPASQVPGSRVFTLGGLYCLSTTTPLEVEFTEILTKRRTVLYVQVKNDTFLFLPAGHYGAHYRLIAAPMSDIRIDMRRLNRFQKLGLYAAKALRLLQHPGRWISVAHGLLRRRANTAVGMRLATPKAHAVPTPVTTRPIERPVALPEHRSVSIIIPTKVRHDLLRACLDSLRRLEGVAFEMIIVDNGATNPDMCDLLTGAALRLNVRVIRHDIPFNFSRLCNLGAAEARHPYLLFLNDDIEAVDGTWLNAMLGFAARKDVGVVGARLLYASGDLQHAGVATNLIPGPGHPWRNAPENVWRTHPLLAEAGEVDAVTGACLLIRHDLFEELEGFDEVRFPITLNDIDLCLKARRKGLKVIYTPDATLLHKEGQSRRTEDRPEEQTRWEAELKAFVEAWPDYARQSVFYPLHLRRDTDTGTAI
ncbi:glycosyltransferase family 2 protein [Asticcacaulis sp. BYS171W]|uniref:Glycosyltransferase family 2 protein n=1 Tax=Asticcacaulis aquaticus TaxID=2984212 RepID=A0ABT5HYR8_9CAUL|nr:glycosyltransferase family 2 protein [Asticcacaulis aquaticus]MDC7685173.1 glycosyltransferase family 2 protein [Asticcacaulis aquaticus]